MARISGVNVPSAKRVEIGLTYIYGIGLTSARKICEKLSLPISKRIKDLSEEETVEIRRIIEADYLVEGDLRREISMNIKRLMDLKTYRGLRHRSKLPVRGQRTKVNARTRKGKPVAIAGKKK